jgi:hypothetical protein
MSEKTQITATDVDGRVETGPLQINDDWPGLFVRGDACIYYAQFLAAAAEATPEEHVGLSSGLRSLADLFASALVGGGQR